MSKTPMSYRDALRLVDKLSGELYGGACRSAQEDVADAIGRAIVTAAVWSSDNAAAAEMLAAKALIDWDRGVHDGRPLQEAVESGLLIALALVGRTVQP